MPAQAGIHDLSVGVTKALDPGAAKKSWMPAFAGMTGFFHGNGHWSRHGPCPRVKKVFWFAGGIAFFSKKNCFASLIFAFAS
jgi:hypothetical protein